jgi:HK97 family phage major capsid protein
MNKRMRELQNSIVSKTAEAKGYMEGENKDIDKFNSVMDDVDALQKEFDAEERLEKHNKSTVPATEPDTEEPKADSIKAFADAARAGFKGMNEGTPADGGYTVPEDISTKINKLKENHFNLASLIDSESVSTNKGSRTYKTRAQQTGFQVVGEGGKITKTGKPQFSRIDYEIKKYAGYLPVTNELLADSDAAIANLIMEWLAGESVATDNAQIIAKFQAASKKRFAGIDDIKKAVIKDLSAFKGSISIITNDDGVYYLDTLKDGNDRYLLSPDPAHPMQMRLAVGATFIPVVQVPNEVMPTAEGGKVPCFVGDPREFLKKFDRKKLTIVQSSTAAVTDFNAFEEDMTLFRGILREDFQVKDAKALVYGELAPVVEG